MKSNTRKLLQPIFDAVDLALSKNNDIQIDEKTYKEYINYHDEINVNKYDYGTVITESKEFLFDKKTEESIKKKLFFLLGHFATKQCFDLLRKYIKDPMTDLKEWATLAIKDIQFKVENGVYENGKDMIMSPMGGKDNKLRYFAVIGSKHNKTLTDVQRKIIKKDLLEIASKTNSEIEKVEYGKNYIYFTILVSFDVAVATVLDGFLDTISKSKNILKYHYFVVNTYKITKKEIDEYLSFKNVKKL